MKARSAKLLSKVERRDGTDNNSTHSTALSSATAASGDWKEGKSLTVRCGGLYEWVLYLAPCPRKPGAGETRGV